MTSIPSGPATRARCRRSAGSPARPFLERCRHRYGDIFTLKIAQEGTWVILADPEPSARSSPVTRGLPRGRGNIVLLPVLGHHSVLLLDEDQHMAQRKLLLPPFHGERMQRYGELMREIAEREIERWPMGARSRSGRICRRSRSR